MGDDINKALNPCKEILKTRIAGRKMKTIRATFTNLQSSPFYAMKYVLKIIFDIQMTH